MYAVFDQLRSAGLGGMVTEKQVLKLIHGGNILVCSTMLCSLDFSIEVYSHLFLTIFLIFPTSGAN